MFNGLDIDHPGLKAVLENNKILKIIHDCRSDWDSLLYQYSVRLFSFIDTQEAYYVYHLFYHQELTLPISLLNFIKIITNTNMEEKIKMKDEMHNDPEIWGKRPLTENMIKYAAEDVKYLAIAWEILEQKLNEDLLEIIKVLSILKVVNKNIFEEFYEYLSKVFFENFKLYQEHKVDFSYVISLDYVYGFFELANASEDENYSILRNAFLYKKKKKEETFRNYFKNLSKDRRYNTSYNNGKRKKSENITGSIYEINYSKDKIENYGKDDFELNYSQSQKKKESLKKNEEYNESNLEEDSKTETDYYSNKGYKNYSWCKRNYYYKNNKPYSKYYNGSYYYGHHHHKNKNKDIEVEINDYVPLDPIKDTNK